MLEAVIQSFDLLNELNNIASREKSLSLKTLNSSKDFVILLAEFFHPKDYEWFTVNDPNLTSDEDGVIVFEWESDNKYLRLNFREEGVTYIQCGIDDWVTDEDDIGGLLDITSIEGMKKRWEWFTEEGLYGVYYVC